eukprot:Nitzschia sp. Nitz4//scaffold36_size144017//115536//117599//NITZ4_003112-RA/size144017-processed-gene-0.91-mRNA-1//-1//CDS//3329549534//9263//frame0
MPNRGFTEAVPLSLSSMAHMTMPLDDGVVDGIKQVLQHTLYSCVNYARATHAPYNWSFRDLATTNHAWEAQEGESPVPDMPPSLTKLGFKHQYHRTACILLTAKNMGLTPQQEKECFRDWHKHEGILGRVSLLYATTALMTKGELDGTERDEDTPKCILYKVAVEYRSLPATGKKAAVQAEELSMLSFGGSVDDDVKYGALASLYDPHAKYVLEIFSVRGKKYTFDLMDSTLSDGTVPRLPNRNANNNTNTNNTSTSTSSTNGNGNENNAKADPFVKSLCVTVTDHATGSDPAEEKPSAMTRMNLLLEGNVLSSFEAVPGPHVVAKEIQATFLSLNPRPPEMATGLPSGHSLLLDPSEAGKVYVNGRFVTMWGQDPRIGSHTPALFGMDLHSIPYLHGRIFDFNVLKRSYAELWQQALATRFKMVYGEDAFPCQAHEMDWVKDRLPGLVPIVVPQRVIDVLRRGGYFDTKRTSDEIWFSESRPAKPDSDEVAVVQKAVELLKQAGCSDVTPNVVVFFSGEGILFPVQKKGLVRFNRSMRQYHVNEFFMDVDLENLNGQKQEADAGEDIKRDISALGYLLGLHIAQEHPDGTTLLRYVLKHR